MKHFMQQNISGLSLFFLMVTCSQFVVAEPDVSGQISQQINRNISQAVSKNVSDKMVKQVTDKRVHVRIHTQGKIREIQQRLFDLGFNPGKVDGFMGNRTRKAIRHFQTSQKLKTDGLLTESLFQ